MKSIHAPWRLEVIKNYEKSEGCILCKLQNSEASKDRENLILHRGVKSFVLMNRFPYTNGHLMFVPREHFSNYSELDKETAAEMHQLKKQFLEILREELNAEGFNMGMNLGEIAGAGIPDHIHEHLVPRWRGDHNFMPVFAEVRVISEHLLASYDKLTAAHQKQMGVKK